MNRSLYFLWVGPGQRRKKFSYVPPSMYLYFFNKSNEQILILNFRRKGLAMGRSDYSLGMIQLIFWIPINLQNFWKRHHGGLVCPVISDTLCANVFHLTFIIMLAKE